MQDVSWSSSDTVCRCCLPYVGAQYTFRVHAMAPFLTLGKSQGQADITNGLLTCCELSVHIVIVHVAITHGALSL